MHGQPHITPNKVKSIISIDIIQNFICNIIFILYFILFIHLDRLQNKCINCKGIKNNTNFGQYTGIQKKLDTRCKYRRMPRNRLPKVMKYYYPTGRRNHGRLLKKLLDTWDRNGPTSGPIAWKIYLYDDDYIIHCKITYAATFTKMLSQQLIAILYFNSLIIHNFS